MHSDNKMRERATKEGLGAGWRRRGRWERRVE